MYLVKAFTQLHVKKIPNAYMLKRYTCVARSFVEWDRNDMPKDGQDRNIGDMRLAKLVPVIMGIARQARSLIVRVRRLMKDQQLSWPSLKQYW
jgi:hypothetical protein